jgi:hypothetical protein
MKAWRSVLLLLGLSHAGLAARALCPAAKLIESHGFVPAPRGIASLSAVLQLQPGFRALEPTESQGLHPLLVPLAVASASDAVSGVLLLPGAKLEDPYRFAPVCTVGPSRAALRPLGENCQSVTRRMLAELDIAGEACIDEAIAAAAADAIDYKRGDATVPLGKAGMQAGLAAYLLPKVGPFLDIYERLASQHMRRGDEASALVTCERAQRAFEEWGLPFAFHSAMQRSLKRDAEARDLARTALSKPLHSLGPYASGERLAQLAETAGYGEPTASRQWYGGVRHADLGGELRYRAQSIGLSAPLLAESDFILSLPFLKPDEHSWDSVRAELAAVYEAEGRPELTRWIEG